MVRILVSVVQLGDSANPAMHDASSTTRDRFVTFHRQLRVRQTSITSTHGFANSAQASWRLNSIRTLHFFFFGYTPLAIKLIPTSAITYPIAEEAVCRFAWQEPNQTIPQVYKAEPFLAAKK